MNIFGLNSLISYGKKESVPYAEAFLCEVQRHATPLPILYRKCFKDTNFNGYAIPKETTLLLNLQASNHDEFIWKDPAEFKPERFLNENGTKFVTNDALMSFAPGRRSCFGEYLARRSLFIYLASLVQKYKIDFERKVDFDSCEPPNIIRGPKEFRVILSQRK